MRYFEDIKKRTKGLKSWKSQNQKSRCDNCGCEIDYEKDHFVLECFWKIKNKSDEKKFCSLDCLSKWIKK